MRYRKYGKSPATLSLGRLAELGPLRPAPAHPGHSLRDGVTFRFCGGIGPLGPAPAHSQMSLRDGIDVRLHGGIRRAPDRNRAGRTTGGWEVGLTVGGGGLEWSDENGSRGE